MGIPKEVHDNMDEYNLEYNSLRGKDIRVGTKKKRNMGREVESSQAGGGEKSGTLSIQAPTPLNGCEANLAA